jgi:hypothetical protein
MAIVVLGNIESSAKRFRLAEGATCYTVMQRNVSRARKIHRFIPDFSFCPILEDSQANFL